MKDQHFNSDDESDATSEDVPEVKKQSRLISVDELRAAGDLDVPPAWRKSLGGRRVERDLFSDLVDDGADEQESAPPNPDSDDSAD